MSHFSGESGEVVQGCTVNGAKDANPETVAKGYFPWIAAFAAMTNVFCQAKIYSGQ
jgi:hypothetical protein